MIIEMKKLGWNDDYNNEYIEKAKENDIFGRITEQQKNTYKVQTEEGELLGEITGKMKYNEDYPGVGDWVILKKLDDKRGQISSILTRKSKFSRKIAGRQIKEQIVATNVDTIFIVTAMNHDFNLRRIERYLTIAWDSGSVPVIILTKADLIEQDELAEKISEVEMTAFGVPIHAVSMFQAETIEPVKQYFQLGKTVALLGSSGVGKSTLINSIAGKEVMETGAIREQDGRGRHTTTHRELISLEDGSNVIDTPGMREIQIWESGDGIEEVFHDIHELSEHCKFNDCTHNSEPGCAVQDAILNGELSEKRYSSFLKLQREAAFIERKKDESLNQLEKKKWKGIAKMVKSIKQTPKGGFR